MQVGRHGQRVLGAVQVRAHDLDRALGLVGLEVRRHGGHPVAEEDVDVAVLERRKVTGTDSTVTLGS